MQLCTDDQLHRLLTDFKSDRVERKETFRGEAPETVREAVCAFANDLAGHGTPGVVLAIPRNLWVKMGQNGRVLELRR